MSSSVDVVVVGGGPAGLLAAGRAAMCGANVVLLEKMEKPARKLRITGKGRCNITSARPYNEFIAEIATNARFLKRAFGEFFCPDIVNLLKEQGVDVIVERGQRVFPKSGRAFDVAEALVSWAKRQGVIIRSNLEVCQIMAQDGHVGGVVVGGEMLASRSVVIATGGRSYPATGSTGDGYKFAADMGHKIGPLFPSLVGVEVISPFAKASGLTLKNVNISLLVNGNELAEEFGEVMFTEFGLEGASTLRLSRAAVRQFCNGQKVSFCIDLKPALSPDKLKDRILRDMGTNANLDFKGLLRGLLPQAIISYVGLVVGFNLNRKLAQFSNSDLMAVVNKLKALKFTMCGYRPWTEAIVTSGGVLTSEVDSQTMQSKLVKGLYFAGEVLDIDANTGGYNLQIAYSTGWLAGQSAANG